jgi:membrane-associated phospholipid phosphatase
MKPEARKGEIFLAWPEPAELRFGLLLCAAFFLFFESTYLATNALTALHRFRFHVHSQAELAIPFVPAMVAGYLSLNLLLALTPFILRTWREIAPLCIVLCLETIVCAACFLLFPVELAYAPQTDWSAWGRFCAAVTALSLPYNNAPSLHVAFAFTAAMAFGARCGRLGRGMLLAWAALVAASTLLIHEHHIVDVVAGIALAVGMRPVYRWASDASRLESLRLELLCLAEFRHFVVRHRRYLFTLLVIYQYSLGRWQRTRIVRAGYCLTQHIDDVLDGDRLVGCDPEAYVRELLRQIAENNYDDSFVSSLTRYVVTRLRGYGDGLEAELLSLFDLLLFDRRRLTERLVLPAEALREHHRRTFYYSLNLTLRACDAELRAADLPELIAALVWCSTMRDLEEDLGKGLINIPSAALDQASASLDYRQLIRTTAVRGWIASEYQRGLAAMDQCDERLKRLAPRKGVAIAGLFLRAIRIYSRKYARQHRDILQAGPMQPLEEARGDSSC